MSLVVQALWLSWGEDQRTTAVDLARMGERLTIALGAPVYARSADTLTPSSASGDVGAWADLYTAQVDAGRGIPLTILWSGVSGLDLRADRLVQAIEEARTSVPAWPVVLERLRTAPQPVRAIADWFYSRSITQTNQGWTQGLFTFGDELMMLHERLIRAWWWAYAQRLPAVPAAGYTVTGQPLLPSQSLGLGAPITPAGTLPSAQGTLVSQPAARTIGLGEILVAAALWALLSR